MANKIVARYADGRLLKGSSLDVDPARPRCHVRLADGTMTPVQLSELKALFFVKSLEGNAKHVEGGEIAPTDPRRRGSKLVQVTFHDGERIVGLSVRYPPNGEFFFLVPVDSRSNNLRILVNSAQVRSTTLVEGHSA
jgi:hypothetical protein